MKIKVRLAALFEWENYLSQQMILTELGELEVVQSFEGSVGFL